MEAAYTERTTENVVKCLTQIFPAAIATAIVWEGAVDMVRQSFGCQRRTAQKLLIQAFDDGQLYELEFLRGALTHVRHGDGTVIEVPGSPYFISEGWQSSLRHDDDPDKELLRIGTGRFIAVALPGAFDPWLADYYTRRMEQMPEQSPTTPDSYWSRKVKGELKEGWSRSTGGVESTLAVVPRGRWGAELEVGLRNEFGADNLPFEIKAVAQLSYPDIKHLIDTLTRIYDDAEKEA